MIRRPPRSTLFPYHDALPIFVDRRVHPNFAAAAAAIRERDGPFVLCSPHPRRRRVEEAITRILNAEEVRSEEHTSELQSPCNLVCRLLLEKKKKKDRALDNVS